MTPMFHRYEDMKGIIHVCEQTVSDEYPILVWTKCGRDVLDERSYKTEVSVITCPYCRNLWNCWHGGKAPIADDQPVEILWHNGIRRTYNRGDFVVWKNLKKDGSVRWRLPL